MHPRKPGPVCSLDAQRDKREHDPMTKEQREILDHRLATIMENLGDTANLLNACYRDKDPRVNPCEC